MPHFRFSPRPNRAHEISWNAWEPQAFSKAQREGKPILLSISAVWCHWCHVMDETTYSDPEVMAAIANDYVAVRVDNDERPDVNARYNMGGWPTTAFLAPDGTTLTGTTYVPPEQMRDILTEIARWYRENESQLAKRGDMLQQPASSTKIGSREDLRGENVRSFADAIAQRFDEEFAGFGDAPKFPQPELLEFLLAEAQACGDERLHRMAVRTLLAMANGGMYDHVEGGFFRYSTTRDWSIPHFEKMAEDHAGLIRVLALLIERSPRHELHATLRSAVDYVLAVLYDPQTGHFAGSQDADEEYYALPLEERRERRAPFVDRTLYADRDAALAGSVVLAGASLEDDAVLEHGIRALEVLHEHMRDPGGLLFHVRRSGDVPEVRGLLADQVYYLRALLDAHEITGEARFLDRAIALVDAIERVLSAPDGGFYDHAGIERALGRLQIQDRPIVENSLLAESLLRSSELVAEPRYRTLAARTLLLYTDAFATVGPFAAAYARALRRYLSTAVSVRIVAALREGGEFREAARRLPSAFVSVRSVDPELAPTLQLPESPAPSAYVCAAHTCGPPVFAPEHLRTAYDAACSHDSRTS
jgi:uncharacterized protein YyaL (SSP411 family)